MAFEIPCFWQLYLGRPYPVGRKILTPGLTNPGYGAAVFFSSDREDVEFEYSISDTSRFQIIDMVIKKGKLLAGDVLTLKIGDIRGSQIRAQEFAQWALFPTGVDERGNGDYRRIAPVPGVDVVGNFAEKYQVIIPSQAQKGDNLKVKVLALDKYGNPASNYPKELKIAHRTGALTANDRCFSATEAELEFEVSAFKHGLGRVNVSSKDSAITGCSNPIQVPDDNSDLNLYFGDIHAQNYDSIGTGSLDEYFQWARDVSLLNFTATANHYGGRFAVSDQIWNNVVEKSNYYNQDHEFVTFVSYEWSGKGGHKNIYYAEEKGPLFTRFEGYDDPDKLWQALEQWDVLTIPHHPKYCDPVDWKYENPKKQRLVEICSAWGISEKGGPHSVQAGLSRGQRLGFIGGTDSHVAQPGTGPHPYGEGNGLACVWAPELTRESIYQGLYDRRCYATMGNRTILKFWVNDIFMGGEYVIKANDKNFTDPIIKVNVAGDREIKSVAIIRNNEMIFNKSIHKDNVDLEFTDQIDINEIIQSNSINSIFYYARVTEVDGRMAWSSPVWLVRN